MYKIHTNIRQYCGLPTPRKMLQYFTVTIYGRFQSRWGIIIISLASTNEENVGFDLDNKFLLDTVYFITERV